MVRALQGTYPPACSIHLASRWQNPRSSRECRMPVLRRAEEVEVFAGVCVEQEGHILEIVPVAEFVSTRRFTNCSGTKRRFESRNVSSSPPLSV